MTIKELKQLRCAARLSQFDVSKRSGIERCRLSMAENDHVTLRAEELRAIEDAIGAVLAQRITALHDVEGSWRSNKSEMKGRDAAPRRRLPSGSELMDGSRGCSVKPRT